LIDDSDGPERLEVILKRTYTGAYGANPTTNVGDRIYVPGPGPDERLAFEDTDGTIYYPHADRQGSTIGLCPN